MATRVGGIAGFEARERGFFLAMAIAIAATIASVFLLQFAMGRSSLDSPWWVHVHALSFMAYLALFVTQTLLVYRGSTALHRRLGAVGAAWLGWMVVIGVFTTARAVTMGRVPFFFEPNVFLAMDWTLVAGAAGLAWAGIALRRRTDWHRRLMLCSMIFFMAPAWGRLLPLPLLGSWALWAAFAPLFLYLAVAVLYDWRARGMVHPAYLWGGAVMVALTAMMRPLASTPLFLTLAARLSA
ncbi:hypothetical protein [Stakelama marina]|uniref:Uncharacterized protein n=1 Tax=Stakelama marina TaxID=2826939 RepID=A0A8T4IIJ2_9SPHN|nr:hypothetical protein [Stakelama marina]MBR0552129.1 hypothetical protein [Stakelama marina]